MATARDTYIPPPRTVVKGESCPAPLAEQFQKVLDDNKIEALLPLRISNDIPPPLLLDGDPTVPIATVTEQLLNDEDCRLMFANATLLAYTAPPPPLAMPGSTDVELVKAEHEKKLELMMRRVKLNPANFSALGGRSTVPPNEETWGECSTDNAPPYTEVVPNELGEGPPVSETAEQFVNVQLVTVTRESCTVLASKEKN
jgi:hypothetical protein